MIDIKWADSAYHLPLDAFKPNPKNPKKHSKAQMQHIRESILHFGFLDPIGVWGEDHIVVEGHGRLEALKQLIAGKEIAPPADGIPCLRLDHLSKRDRDAYMLEHNQATMETGWDDDLLDELIGDITQDGLDMSLFGFDVPGELEDDDKYTKDINIPQYEVRGETPNFADMLDSSKADALIDEINAADVSAEEKAFLIQAARRHNVFNYRHIAEYYAQASPQMQRLMERSALVIIDYDDAVANGFVKLQGVMKELLEGDDGDDA
ncbi:MAG: ParB N-terminal domain-containing protein [Clostridia bacterium]|nr:ParB N-terminal domain-containing protein [Clostridia bacterium]